MWSNQFQAGTNLAIGRQSTLAATGAVEIVPAKTGKKIRILALAIFATNKTTVTNVYVHNEDNDLVGDSSNPIPISNDVSADHVQEFVLPFNPGGWCDTDVISEAVKITLSAAQDVQVFCTYAYVD